MDEKQCVNALVWLHSNLGHVKRLSDYIRLPAHRHMQMSTVSVVDVTIPPDENMVFREKVDGEPNEGLTWCYSAGVWGGYKHRQDRPDVRRIVG
jgi:hypothetical protein